MAVFKCNISGNTMEVFTALDIHSMEVHPGYTLVEEKPVVEEGHVIQEDIVVNKKKSKKKNQEL